MGNKHVADTVVVDLRLIANHGYSAVRDHGVASGAGSLVAGEADVGVAVSSTQGADVAGDGEITEYTCLPFGSPLFWQVRDPLFSLLQLPMSKLLQLVEVSSQLSVLICRAIISCLQTSLYRSWFIFEIFCRRPDRH